MDQISNIKWIWWTDGMNLKLLRIHFIDLWKEVGLFTFMFLDMVFLHWSEHLLIDFSGISFRREGWAKLCTAMADEAAKEFYRVSVGGWHGATAHYYQCTRGECIFSLNQMPCPLLCFELIDWLCQRSWIAPHTGRNKTCLSALLPFLSFLEQFKLILIAINCCKID